jgi:hypothetical protein
MWIDTCCIDRANAVEYNESVNSMFKWYHKAGICITYLSDVQLTPHRQGTDVFRSYEKKDCPSIWFSRGWTLQELLAPKNLEFYDRKWGLIGTKEHLAPALAQITRINVAYLTGSEDFREASVAAKMSWQAGRQTLEPEDIAYSMLGLLGITMTPLYGEGAEESFYRLQHKYIKRTADESLFAWKMPADGPGKPSQRPQVYGGRSLAEDEWGLFAPSPEWFRFSGNVTNRPPKSGFVARTQGVFSREAQGTLAPLTIGLKAALIVGLVNFTAVATFVGVIPILIWIGADPEMKIPINAWELDEKGKLKWVTLYMRRRAPGWLRVRSKEYCLGADKPLDGNQEPPYVVLQPKARD